MFKICRHQKDVFPLLIVHCILIISIYFFCLVIVIFGLFEHTNFESMRFQENNDDEAGSSNILLG